MQPVLVALDVPTLEDATRLAGSVADSVGGFKVGLELYCRYGPKAVDEISAFGPVFLDVKLHDIPATVGRAAEQLGRLGVWAVTIHAAGGSAMMRAAADGLAKGAADTGADTPHAIGVTVLTSQSDEDARALSMPPAAERVPLLAQAAVAGGATGIVCAGPDLETLAGVVPDGTLRITPGIRPAGAATHDQARVMTPRQALAAGATHLVVGRPIRDAADPAAAARTIAESLSA